MEIIKKGVSHMFFRGKWKWTFEMKAAVFLWVLALVVDIFMDKSRPEVMWLLVISLFFANTIAIIEYIKMGKMKKE